MNNSTVLKSLLIYALCVPLAIFLGYLLGDPLSISSFGAFGIIVFFLLFPLVMKWHYPLMLLSWNMSLSGLFFLPGSPNVWLLLVALSFGMAIFERALLRHSEFVVVPQIVLPLLFMVAVVLITAKLTGGFGLRSMGSKVYGGKKYVYLLAAIASYFVLTARTIPKEKAYLYLGLFYLGGITNAIGDLFPITPKALQFIFWIFPPTSGVDAFEFGTTRLRGVGVAGAAVYSWMLFRYGIGGIFSSQKIWRPLLFFVVAAASLLGGFRSVFLSMTLLFTVQFFLEGQHRRGLMPVFVFSAILGAVLLIPLAPKLPFTIQRALAILPLDIDPMARYDAEQSSKWRLDLWESVLPQVPRHLLLGKGYAITQDDYQMMGYDVSFKAFDASQQGLALSMDYHNGPLSVIIPFGVWGAFGFCWFLGIALWVLIRNYRFSDPSLQLINTFLLAVFIQQAVMFFFVYGAFNSDMITFAGILGLNVSLNGGVCRKPATEPVEVVESVSRPRLLSPRPSFQR